MTNGAEIPDALADALEKIRREAYAAGWRDALAAVNKATANFGAPENIPETSTELSNTNAGASTAGGPTPGSTPWYVLQAVRKRHAMTGSEVVSVVQEGGHKVSEASIRTSLVRLEKRKLIVSRHKKWFPQGS